MDSEQVNVILGLAICGNKFIKYRFKRCKDSRGQGLNVDTYVGVYCCKISLPSTISGTGWPSLPRHPQFHTAGQNVKINRF